MEKRKIVSCAACRLQCKKCSEECILAPYFPRDDPDKFTIVQRLYGTSNIVKLLQSLEAKQREDAVKSLVCEASARIKEPIRGSASVVHELQKQIAELESQLESKQEELMNMRSEYDKLLFLLRNGSTADVQHVYGTVTTEDTIYEQLDPLLLWEPISNVAIYGDELTKMIS
ncbi:hypothetical protein SUGI_0679140 [Cryptomeria japonica]|uniref:LOB domain-containing protein 1-like n=1 Tax=Cryptomeria japonica TaxID=3369 RepID=UPI002414CEFB|nr:LOB domain-containing protein 1-like [Cryptomeria japonica]GLJ33792.1 hypothetical protein SUGI_0679140 [Cryptomeria japonica]